ncbi:MAG: metalloregulator ArsR/SmtB family transcription factor [Pseudomonadota bacterium]
MNAVLKALSHPIRRAVLKHLRGGDATAGELAALFAVAKPTMSRHFQVLKDADLVAAERRGTEIIYSFNASVADELVAGLADLFGTAAHENGAQTASSMGAGMAGDPK